MTPISRMYGDSTLTVNKMATTIKDRSRNSSATTGNNWSSVSKSPVKQFRSRPVGVVSKKLMGEPETCRDKSNPDQQRAAGLAPELEEDVSYP